MSSVQGQKQCELFYKEKFFGKKNHLRAFTTTETETVSVTHMSQHGCREWRAQVPRVIGIITLGTDAAPPKVQGAVHCSGVLQPITSKLSKVKRGKLKSTIMEDYLARTLNFTAFP